MSFALLHIPNGERAPIFERLIKDCLTGEPAYADLYEKVWMYSDWARERGIDARDTGSESDASR